MTWCSVSSLAKLELILVIITSANGLDKSFVHVEIFPDLGAGLAAALEALIFFLLLDLITGHGIVNVVDQVRLGEDDHDWLIGLVVGDFQLPVCDVFK